MEFKTEEYREIAAKINPDNHYSENLFKIIESLDDLLAFIRSIDDNKIMSNNDQSGFSDKIIEHYYKIFDKAQEIKALITESQAETQ